MELCLAGGKYVFKCLLVTATIPTYLVLIFIFNYWFYSNVRETCYYLLLFAHGRSSDGVESYLWWLKLMAAADGVKGRRMERGKCPVGVSFLELIPARGCCQTAGAQR